MVLRKPTANDRLAYFTKRSLPKDGKACVWRFDGEELANIEYTCPFCGNSGEKQQVFERQKVRLEIGGKKKPVEAFIFSCDKCSKNIELPKWVKKGPGKKKQN